MLDEVAGWLQRRSWTADHRPLPQLLAAKRAAGARGTVSVVLPALDEEATVGAIVGTIRRELMSEAVPLVDELVVLDSGSTDRTAEVAAAAGAVVVHRDEVLPRLPALPGKGEVLWRSLLVTRGEIVCFVDSDLREFDARFVSGIVGPLLTDPDVQLVKAMYDRPLETGGTVVPAGGGRVTELVARPLLNLHWPQLAGFVQPLGGEYAARRSLLERLPFPVGYGVELGLLVDALNTVGLDALAQVDVGSGTTGTRTARHWAAWPRRSTGRRRSAWPGAISCGPSSRSSTAPRTAVSSPASTRSRRMSAPRCGRSPNTPTARWRRPPAR